MAEKNMPNLKAKYQAEVAPALMQKFGYKSTMQIPRIEKIVVNCGCGEARDNAKVLEAVVGDLTKITGQKAIITKAKKSVANFIDGRGNYALGIKEQLIFPEIEYDKIDKIRGMDVVICTTAKTDEEAKELLSLIGAPFAR